MFILFHLIISCTVNRINTNALDRRVDNIPGFCFWRDKVTISRHWSRGQLIGDRRRYCRVNFVIGIILFSCLSAHTCSHSIAIVFFVFHICSQAHLWLCRGIHTSQNYYYSKTRNWYSWLDHYIIQYVT